MPFTSAFSTRNASGSIHGPVSKRVRERIPGLIAPPRPSKYPFSLVQEIRRKYEEYDVQQKDLAVEYGISLHVVQNWCQYLQRVHG